MRSIFCVSLFLVKLLSPVRASFNVGILSDKCEKKLNSVQKILAALLMQVEVVRGVSDSN
jgi:hypothetical protein